MDYTLTSLCDAFVDRNYKRSLGNFSIYGILLATSLDQEFLLDYLQFFFELHELTGDRLLIIGPQLVPKSSRKSRPSYRELKRPTVDIRDIELNGIRKVLIHDEDDERFWNGHERNESAGKYLQFMQDQTRESYDIARFLGIRADLMPAFVFLDNLDAPENYVVWTLQEKTGKEFVQDLRVLLAEVGDRCYWKLEEQNQECQRRLELLRKNYVDLPIYGWRAECPPAELQDEWQDYVDIQTALIDARSAESKAQSADRFYKQLAVLRGAYDKLCAIPNLKLPLTNIGKTIEKLESGEVDRGAFDHLARHLNRWKSRMTPEYKTAVQGFWYADVSLEHAEVPAALAQAAAELSRLGDKLLRLKGIFEHKQLSLIREAEEALLDARRKASGSTENELAVIREILKGDASTRQKSPERFKLRESVAGSHDRVPRVFISYSHDTAEHKSRVLELAQRLRGDGVDCWIDQFEDSPPQGFPRWMQHQIAQADYVLLVCTPIYHRRFDGLEAIGNGKGANFEGHLILQTFYDDSSLNKKFIPIFFPEISRDEVPLVLRGATSYQIPSEYDLLKMRLLAIPNVTPQPLGRVVGGTWHSF